MSEFGKEVKELRVMLAEQGIEVTLERLLDLLEAALKVDRACPDCMTTPLGLCVDCLIRLAKGDKS